MRAGRVWACTRRLQYVYAAAELVRRGRVVVLASYVMSTAAVGRAILLHNSIGNNPIYVNISDLKLCLQPLALIILKLGMMKDAVSNWN